MSAFATTSVADAQPEPPPAPEDVPADAPDDPNDDAPANAPDDPVDDPNDDAPANAPDDPIDDTPAASPDDAAAETAPDAPADTDDTTMDAADVSTTVEPRAAHTAASVADAPRPNSAGGIAVPESHPEHALLWIPRVFLFVPRIAVEIVDAPIRGAAWTFERYQLQERFFDIFFNEAGTIGLFPVVYLESDYGFNAGLRFISRNTLGRGEGVSARASWGGRFDQSYSLSLDSGERFGDRVVIELEGEYERRPKDKFFGIGNADEVDDASGLDALGRPVAVKSRYRQNLSRVFLGADLRLFGDLSLRPSAALLTRSFDDSDSASASEIITDNFEVGSLVGWEDGVSQIYPELELRWDARETPSRFEPQNLYSTGWLASAFVGYAQGFSDDDSAFGRYGVDLQRFFRLAQGPRIFALRAYLEGVTGDLDEIPFTELPSLGGPLLLRGYDRDRFHDRVLAITSAEYQFDLEPRVSALLFVDVGRVYPSISDLSVDELRLGFGAGLDLHTYRSFLARATVESSIDGGVFFNLSFDPVYDPEARTERE